MGWEGGDEGGVGAEEGEEKGEGGRRRKKSKRTKRNREIEKRTTCGERLGRIRLGDRDTQTRKIWKKREMGLFSVFV